MQTARGFSLVELLVVVAIIAILVALVVPSLNRAKVLARETQCRSNLCQLSKAYYSYCSAHGGNTQPYVVPLTRETFWMELLRKYHGRMDEIRDCPTVTRRSGGWGETFVAWGPASGGFYAGHSGAYAINGWVYNMMHDTRAWADQWDYESIFVPNPSNVPVFCDSSWVDAWPLADQTPCPHLLLGGQSAEPGMWRVCIARHGMAINVSFVDGSSRKVPLGDLWELDWHDDWEPVHDMYVPEPGEE